MVRLTVKTFLRSSYMALIAIFCLMGCGHGGAQTSTQPPPPASLLNWTPSQSVPIWTQTQASPCGWGNSQSTVQSELRQIHNSSPWYGFQYVNSVRSKSAVVTALPGTDAESRLQGYLTKLLWFQINDYIGNCESRHIGTLDLLPTNQNFKEAMACPSGPAPGCEYGATDPPNHITSLFEEDSLYSVGPWSSGYAPVTGSLLNQQVFSSGGLWDRTSASASVCQDDEDWYVVGKLPGWDGGTWIDPEPTLNNRCAIYNPPFTTPSFNQRFSRTKNYYSTTASDSTIYGTNSQETNCDTTGCSLTLLPISTTGTSDAHDQLKYGCLRQALKGNFTAATGYFADALAQWDGTGFPDLTSSNSQDYYTHDLAFALLCANALGSHVKDVSAWTPALQSTIETQLWALQDTGTDGISGTGGIWNRYCNFCPQQGVCTATQDPTCQPNPYSHISTGIAKTATMLNEDAAAVLGAYGRNVWSSTQ